MSRTWIACNVQLLMLTLSAESIAADPHPPPSRRLTIELKDQPLAEALRVIRQSVGIAIDAKAEIAERRVSFAATDQPFWPALDALARSADARIDLYDRSGRLMLAPRGSAAPPISYDGLFRCSLRRVTAVRDFESGASVYGAQLEVAWEPHLEPLLLETQPRAVVVKDGAGQTLPVAAEGSSLAPVDGKLALTLDVPLPSVSRAVARLSLFEGQLTVIAPTKMLTLTFGTLDELRKAPADAAQLRRTEGGMSATLTRVVVEPDRCTVQVRLDLPPGGPSLESYQSWVVNNEMLLVKGDARRKSRNYLLESSTARRAIVSYHFTDEEILKAPGDWKVVYRTPAGLCVLPIRFAFKNVPLP